MADGYTTLTSQIPVTLSAGQNVTTADFPFTPLISKQVSKPNANPGDTLYFTTTVNYLGNDLFETVRVRDPLPAGTTYVTGSANMSGTFGLFVSEDDQPAVDDLGTYSTGITMAVTPTVIAINGTVTVTMQLTTTQTITNVTPLLPDINGGNGTCTGPLESVPANVTAGTPRTFTSRCTLTSQGEFTFDGSASGALGYDFPGATSNSLLVSRTGSASVVTWPLGSSVAGTPGVVILTGSLPGIYAFEGNNTTAFWRYGTVLNNWTTKTNAPANVRRVARSRTMALLSRL